MAWHRTSGLSAQQRRVLELIASGQTNAQIARELGLTLDGAKYHVSEVFNKLGVNSREAASAVWKTEHRGISQRLRGLLWPATAIVAGAAAVAAGIFMVGSVKASHEGSHTAIPSPSAPATAMSTARQRLAETNPAWTTFIDAVESGDVPTVLEYLHWQKHVCAPWYYRIVNSPECQDLGIAEGTMVPMFPMASVPLPTQVINAEWDSEDTLWRGQADVASAFDHLLQGRHPQLELVASGDDGRMYLTFSVDPQEDETGFLVNGLTFQMQPAEAPLVNIYAEVGNQASPLGAIQEGEQRGGQHFEIWGVSPELEAEEAAIQRARHQP